MKKLAFILIVFVLLFAFCSNSESFELKLMNDYNKTLTGFVYRIDHNIEQYKGMPLINCAVELEPKEIFTSEYDRSPGKYIVVWNKIFTDNEKFKKIVYGFEVKDNINIVVLTPIYGIGCEYCKKKEVLENIWVLEPNEFY